jgi:hypothetical protein
MTVNTSERTTYKPFRQLASTSGSSELSIRKFDGTNFNFWKEQMQDYLIVRGYIDPIEHDTAPTTYKPDETGSGSSCDNPDASVRIRVLHGLGVYNS